MHSKATRKTVTEQRPRAKRNENKKGSATKNPNAAGMLEKKVKS